MNITLNNYSNIDFDTIDIRDEWNKPKDKELLMHRIHTYPAKFPAFITIKAIEKMKEQKISVNTIADIFCGCGTVALEALRCGKHFWGCDINPVATLIAETKSRTYDDERLESYFRKIIHTYNTTITDTNSDVYSNERIRYWFDESHIDELLRLRSSINSSVDDDMYLKFFLCAFSNILKSCSRWLSKSIKPQIDPNKTPKNVIKSYSLQIDFMRRANLELGDIKEKAEIKNINFLDYEPDKPFVDLIVSSPPYVTSYEYADLHQLSTLWLGYTDDFRTLRKGTIGSIYHSNEGEFDNLFNKLNDTGKDVVKEVYDINRHQARSIAQYYLDMQNAVIKISQILNPKGVCLFVIGNTKYKGKKIDNVKHLTESLLKTGFENIEVDKRKISNKILTPYRDSAGRFTYKRTYNNKVYSEEFVIFAKRN